MAPPTFGPEAPKRGDHPRVVVGTDTPRAMCLSCGLQVEADPPNLDILRARGCGQPLAAKEPPQPGMRPRGVKPPEAGIG